MPESSATTRRTEQREAVAAVIEGSDGPLLVPQIHEQAAKKVPGLGIATVYRAVNKLIEDGRIKTVTLPDGKTRYEAAGLDHHHHFRCRACDRVFDIGGCGVSIKDGSEIAGGFLVDGHELTLFGLCPDCRG